MVYRPEIDGLRALAVVLVILFHAGWTVFSGGYIGVDVFFVISGYLITSILISDLNAKKFSFLKFYERRARRILPALFFVMLLSMPFAWLWLLPVDFQDFSESVAAVTLFVSNILFWQEAGYFDTAEALKPLLHTWSLGIEEQFYLLYPVLLLSIWKYGRDYFGGVLLAGIVISCFIAEYSGSHHSSANFFLLPSRGWELLAGAYLAYLENTKPLNVNQRLSSFLTGVGMFLIIISAVLFDKQTKHPGLITFVPIAGTVLIIAFGRTKSISASFLSHRYIVGIGLISYSLYLWHQPIFAFARTYSLKELTAGMYFMLIAISFMLALFSYKYVEAPFRNREKISTRTFVYLSTILSVCFIIFGVSGVVTSGFPGRLPDDLMNRLEGEKYKKIYVQTTDDWVHCFEKKPSSACILGNKNLTVTWALVGDSHAGALAQSLDKALKGSDSAGVFLAKEGCVYALGLRRGDVVEDECLDHNYLVQARLQQPDINNIVISGRYVMYLERSRFDNGEGGVEPGLPVDFGPVQYSDENERRQKVSQSYKDTIKELLGNGKRVFLVYPVPEVGWDVPRQAFKQKFKGIDEPVTTSAAIYYERSRSVIKIFDSIGDHMNLVRIYPDRILCNTIIPERCVTEIDNEILYADDDHLSVNGAALVIQQIMDEPRKPVLQ